MPNSFGIWGVNQQTQCRFRILCVAKGITAHELFKQMVDNAWENKETVPSKSGERMIKKIVKRAVNRNVFI